MSVIQNFKERVRSPVFNTAVKTFATNPITLTTLQPEGEFAKLESGTARRHEHIHSVARSLNAS